MLKSVVVVVSQALKASSETIMQNGNPEWEGAEISISLEDAEGALFFGARFYDRGPFATALEDIAASKDAELSISLLKVITIDFEDVPDLAEFDARGHFARVIGGLGLRIKNAVSAAAQP